MKPPEEDPHYFSLKGKKAEQAVHLLAEKTFLSDWCYLNPKLPNGKELCDLLIIFDDIAIIWQIKDLKLSKDGHHKKQEIDKNLRQLSGARRKLLDVSTSLELVNPRRGKEIFDPKSVKEIYLISALMSRERTSFSFIEEFKKLTIHVFDKQFTEIVLNELNTISDFIAYLRAKETIVNSNKEIMVVGGEEELLALYIFNEKTFNHFKSADFITIDEGSWERLLSKPEYKAKKEADKVSYLWDGIISRAHESKLPEYEMIARELARHDRFQRRYFSQTFLDAAIKAGQNKERDMFRRVIFAEGVTYCFLFMDDPEPRERRKLVLFAMCLVARGKYPENKKVIGIATEKTIEPLCSYDFCLFNKPDWTEADQKQMEEIQNQTGLFVSPSISRLSADEYPSE